MEKRKIVFGSYDTAREHWTLCEWAFPEPDYQAKFVEIPGGIPLDVSAALTDDEPSYGSRTLTARLENSAGTYLGREERIRAMVNELDGRRMNIVLPDYPGYYISGRVQVKKEFNNLAYASVVVTAVCDPWLYRSAERMYTLTAATDKRVQVLTNAGRCRVIPELTVTGDDASVLLEWGTLSVAVGSGTTILPDLSLPHGDTYITYSGTGTMQISYREAVL